MLTLTGTLLNVFQAPQGVTKEGKQYGGEYKVQFQGTNELKNGESRIELLTLTTENPAVFRDYIGQKVNVPVGVFAAKSGLQYFLPPTAKPIPASDDL
jgi:hypothetical protein